MVLIVFGAACANAQAAAITTAKNVIPIANNWEVLLKFGEVGLAGYCNCGMIRIDLLQNLLKERNPGGRTANVR
jgi:hypothetical protein